MTGPLVAAVVLGGCRDGFLAPGGPIAAAQRLLLLKVFVLTLIVVTPVLVFMPWLLWRYRRGARSSAYRPRWEFSWPLELLAWGVPVVVVAILGWFLWARTLQLDPYRPLASRRAPLQVQVVGLDWKWLFIYPKQHIASVGQMAVPVGRPVHLTITSDSVMQSLLIPRLGGQIYAMSGMKTQLYLQADHSGRFLGENTQYNGRGFQHQKFHALALSDKAFVAWVAGVRSQGSPLDCRVYHALAVPGVVSAPRYFSRVQPDLFDWIVATHHLYPTPACGAMSAEHGHG